MLRILGNCVVFAISIVLTIGVYSFSTELVKEYSEEAYSASKKVTTSVSFSTHSSNFLEEESIFRCLQQTPLFFRILYKYSFTKPSLAHFSRKVIGDHTFEYELSVNQFTQHLFSKGNVSSYLNFVQVFIL